MSDVPEGPLTALREQSRKGVQYLLNYMLANAEQYLLGLAGKAPSKGEQANIYEAMRELRLKRRALEEKYAVAVMGGLDDFGANPAPPPAAPPKPTEPAPLSLQAGALGLMQEQRLEESLMVENVASRARIDHREALLALGRHVSAQTGQRRVDIDALPVGPLALTRHFMQVCNDIEVSPQSRLIFVKVFSRFIIEELGPFYAQCLAALPVENDDAAEQARAAGIEAQAPTDLPTGERYDDRSQASPLHQQAEIAWDNARTPLLTAPGKAMAMPRTLLDEILLRLQQQLLDRKKPLANLNPKAGILPFEIFELINGELEEMGQTKPLALALDVIETVSLVRLLFDHALRDQKVVQPVRRLVRLLQIPVLRAALQDPEVLSGVEHPVRALFREIGTASIGCAPQGDPAGDAFFRLLQSLVGRIIGGFGTDLAIFSICLQELRAYLLTEQGRARLLERHTLTAEVGRSEREAAREAVGKIVAGAVGNAPAAARAHRFPARQLERRAVRDPPAGRRRQRRLGHRSGNHRQARRPGGEGRCRRVRRPGRSVCATGCGGSASMRRLPPCRSAHWSRRSSPAPRPARWIRPWRPPTRFVCVRRPPPSTCSWSTSSRRTPGSSSACPAIRRRARGC